MPGKKAEDSPQPKRETKAEDSVKWEQTGDFREEYSHYYSPSRTVSFYTISLDTKIKSLSCYADDMGHRLYVACHDAKYTEELKNFLKEKNLPFKVCGEACNEEEIYLETPNTTTFYNHLDHIKQFDSNVSKITETLIAAVCTHPILEVPNKTLRYSPKPAPKRKNPEDSGLEKCVSDNPFKRSGPIQCAP